MDAYVPLWVKSYHSFLQGASSPEELVEEAKALGLSSLAVTDRDGIYGVVRAHVKAKEVGIRLIIGSQVTVGEDRESEGEAGEGRKLGDGERKSEAADSGPETSLILLAVDRSGERQFARRIHVCL